MCVCVCVCVHVKTNMKKSMSKFLPIFNFMKAESSAINEKMLII